MAKQKLTRNRLAAGLGLSLTQVNNLAARGMPIDSVARAKAWRQANVGLPGGRRPPSAAELAIWRELYGVQK